MASSKGEQDLRIGITGHQQRAGIRWQWVREQIAAQLQARASLIEGYSSLAEGSDQIFAQTVLDLGGTLYAVIPMPAYERVFSSHGLQEYLALKSRSKPIVLEAQQTDEISFFTAGKFIVEKTEIIFAVWDGQPSEGFGGTADIVDFAKFQKKRIIHINPITQITLEI